MPLVSSAVCQHASATRHGGTLYATGSYYLISPLTTWHGDLRVADRSVYQGAIRPGMLRLAAPADDEHKSYPGTAKALVVRLPEPWLRKVVGYAQTEELKRSPILYVHADVRKLASMMSRTRYGPHRPDDLVTEGLTRCFALRL